MLEAPRAWSCSACTPTSARQIFDSSGFEVAARRVLALHARISDELGVDAARARPRRRLRHRLHHPGRPVRPRAARHRDDQDRRARVPRARRSRSRGSSIEPGRAIVGPAMCTVYRSARSSRSPSTAARCAPTSRVDGGMSDNIRTALYDADYSCTLASRAREAPPVLARVVGKHCEAGDIVVKDEFLPGDVAPGDLIAVPGTGAYCRSMASNYNHALRPPVIAVRDGRTTRRRAPRDRGRSARHRRGDGPRDGDEQATEGGRARLRLGRLAGRPAARRSRPTTSRRASAHRSSWSGSPYAASTRRARSTCPTGC